MLTWFRRRQEARREQLDALIRSAVKDAANRIESEQAQLRAENATLSAELSAARTERDHYKQQLRAQAEADLVLASLRIVMKAVMNEPRDPVLEQTRDVAQRQYDALRQNPLPYAALGLLGGLGSYPLQNIFQPSKH